MATFVSESASICGPKDEPLLVLGRLRSTSQSVTIWAKKKVFWSSGSFFVLFFYWLFFGFLFPHLSVVCLSHLVFMPQTWHMPSPYPHPSIHVSNLTNPCVHTVLSPPQTNGFVFCLSFSRLRRPRRHSLCHDCAQRVLEEVLLHPPKLTLLHFSLFLPLCLTLSLSYLGWSKQPPFLLSALRVDKHSLSKVLHPALYVSPFRLC